MTVLILQSALLIAIAYILGCILGCLLRTIFGSDSAVAAPAAAVTAAGAAAATAAVAAARPAPVEAPKPDPVRAPEPVALAQMAMPEAAAKPKASAKAKAPAKPKAKPAKAKAAAKPAEPVAAMSAPAPAKAKPKAAPKPKAAAVAAGPDNLKLIRGIGRQNEARLNALGVTRFAQIAAWKAKDAAEWGERLAFPGRIEREEWIAQAKVLASGKATDFSKRVKRGAVESSAGSGAPVDLGKKPRLLKAARKGGPDNLTLIDGVGNAIEKRLQEIGIYHFDQIAKLTDAEATWIGNEIGFPGRVQRENWIAESKLLAEGRLTDHARRVEEGKIATSRVSTKAEKKAKDGRGDK